jgi:hypothetical protein
VEVSEQFLHQIAGEIRWQTNLPVTSTDVLKLIERKMTEVIQTPSGGHDA